MRRHGAIQKEGGKRGGEWKMPCEHPMEYMDWQMEPSPWGTSGSPIGQQNWMTNYEEPLNVSWTENYQPEIEDNWQQDPSWMKWEPSGKGKGGMGNEPYWTLKGKSDGNKMTEQG